MGCNRRDNFVPTKEYTKCHFCPSNNVTGVIKVNDTSKRVSTVRSGDIILNKVAIKPVCRRCKALHTIFDRSK